jgi:hypothetical protein
MTIFSKKLDFKHKIEYKSILNHFRIAVSHISNYRIGFTPYFKKISKYFGSVAEKIKIFTN